MPGRGKGSSEQRGPFKRPARPFIAKPKSETPPAEGASKPRRRKRSTEPRNANVSVARALSKLGFCSRSEAIRLVRSGQVTINREVVKDENTRVDPARDRIHVNGEIVRANKRVYLMLNKPRGAVTTASDEMGRVTVHDLLPEDLPHVSAVGRLDRDSEGLLLMTNDTRWANRIIAPESHVDKTYHVMVTGRVTDEVLKRIREGVTAKRGDALKVKSAEIYKPAGRNTWLEVVLDEGKNRHIRRLFEALDMKVERLQRVAIGPLKLGDLYRGNHRLLTPEEVEALGGGGGSPTALPRVEDVSLSAADSDSDRVPHKAHNVKRKKPEGKRG